MSLERADSISPEQAAQYKKANSMLKTCDYESVHSSDSDSESGTEPSSKLFIDMKKMPAGQYEYYTDTTNIINQMLLYMYHTINNLVFFPTGETAAATAHPMPLKLRRRPYKYDKEDFCYVQIGYGDYKYKYTVPATIKSLERMMKQRSMNI
jgi:hypothetical protein